MIYDTLDTIPLKLFLRLRQTDELHLLSDENIKLKKLKKIWDALKEAYEKTALNAEGDKLLRVTVRIEILRSKHDSIKIAVNSLRFERNLDLENMIRYYGYKLEESSFLADLEHLDRESDSILVKIERLSEKLPKDDGADSGTSMIDKIIMGYCAVVGITYNTNTISVTQFDALKGLFDDKLKSIEAGNAKNNKK